ncbi:MAG: 3'-5' exonuclease, partial [Ketobacteraceae bacterium]|nr:3'-5' exonuclease [Ketobacteraceae bacterium]
NTLPLESGFGAKPQVADEPQELHRKAARALLHSLEDNSEWSEGLTVLLSQLDNQYARLEELLMALLARREEWVPLITPGMNMSARSREAIKAILESNLESIIHDSLTHLRDLIPASLHSELVGLAGYAAKNLEREGRNSAIRNCLDMDLENRQLPGSDYNALPQWQGIKEMLLTNNGTWRSSLTVACGFPTSKDKEEKARCDAQKARLKEVIAELRSIDAILPALNDIPLLPADRFSDEQWELLNALFEVLPVLVGQLTLVFQETNTVDFAEISIKARAALGDLDDPSDLALKLDYQIRHILVDEFQDTSHSQVDLLEKLTAGWTPGDGRTLFCVGDAMQSIYGFRGANVGLFLNCREHGLGHVPLEPLRLNTNFRSDPGIVQWVNRTFAKAFPVENDISRGAVTYSPSETLRDDSREPAVQVHGLMDQQDNSAEARAMLDIIRSTQSNHPEQVIAILVRSRGHASDIARLLASHGTAYRAVDLEPLESQSIIQDLLALTQAMLHPGDRTSWLAVLRAPWCGLSLVDLEAIANVTDEHSTIKPTVLHQVELALTASQRKNPRQPPRQNDFFAPNQCDDGSPDEVKLTDDGRTRLKRVLPILKAGLAQRDRKPLRLWIEGLWIALNGPACLQDNADLTNAEKYLELLQNWTYATDLPGFFHIRDAVQQLFAAPDPEASDKLQIMTIHKSKGLEFDVVLLPGLSSGTRPNTAGLLMWHQRLNRIGSSELVMAPITAKGQEKHPTQQYLIAEDSKKAAFEACRLLYVACTRAKQKLHLFANLKTSPKDETISKPGSKTLLSSIWDAVEWQVIRHESPVPAHPSRNSPEPPPLIRLPRNWQSPELAAGHLLDVYIPRFQYSNNNPLEEAAMQSPTARHTGTLIHRYLELIGKRGIENWRSDTLQQHQRHIRNNLKALGVPATELDNACHKVTLAIELVLQDKKAGDFLSNRHPFTANEYPITFKSQTGPKNLVIDRLYTTNKGTTWVVDYKTATPRDDQTIEEFLKEQKEHHEPQLKLYQTALQQAGFDKVKTALYFPMSATWLALDGMVSTE